MLAPIAAVPQSWRLECSAVNAVSRLLKAAHSATTVENSWCVQRSNPARVEPSTDSKAIGSLICGILSVTILSVLAGI